MSDQQPISQGSKTQGEGKSMHHKADSKAHIGENPRKQDIPAGSKEISDDLAAEKERNKELYDK